MDTNKRIRHVEKFRKYNPKFEEYFVKPKSSGKKPNDRKRTRKPEAEIYIDRISNLKPHKTSVRNSRIMEDPKLPRRVTYELHLRSMIPRLVDRCQGNCGEKLLPADEYYCLLVKSWGRSNFFYKGENKSKYGPQYIHFKNDCLKEYAHFKHEMHYDEFPFDLVEIGKATLSKLSEEDKASLEQYGLKFI